MILTRRAFLKAVGASAIAPSILAKQPEPQKLKPRHGPVRNRNILYCSTTGCDSGPFYQAWLEMHRRELIRAFEIPPYLWKTPS